MRRASLYSRASRYWSGRAPGRLVSVRKLIAGSDCADGGGQPCRHLGDGPQSEELGNRTPSLQPATHLAVRDHADGTGRCPNRAREHTHGRDFLEKQPGDRQEYHPEQHRRNDAQKDSTDWSCCRFDCGAVGSCGPAGCARYHGDMSWDGHGHTYSGYEWSWSLHHFSTAGQLVEDRHTCVTIITRQDGSDLYSLPFRCGHRFSRFGMARCNPDALPCAWAWTGRSTQMDT